MINYQWNDDKNEELKQSRGVSFEDVLFHIANDDLLDVLEHPNKEKYPNQKIFVININGYVYYVPFVEDADKIFLKTIIPSRKLNKKY
jgi:uncharacterized DUF497 family protein